MSSCPPSCHHIRSHVLLKRSCLLSCVPLLMYTCVYSVHNGYARVYSCSHKYTRVYRSTLVYTLSMTLLRPFSKADCFSDSMDLNTNQNFIFCFLYILLRTVYPNIRVVWLTTFGASPFESESILTTHGTLTEGVSVQHD
jgi:hypothetical protein